MDVTYDPLNPSLSSRPVSRGFIARTVSLALTGLVLCGTLVAEVTLTFPGPVGL